MKRRQLSLSVRLFLFYAAFVALSGWFVVREVLKEVKPAVRQSTEEALVDTANLLAELSARDLREGRLSQGELPLLLARYGQRRPRANIWGIEKSRIEDRIYIVDRQGIVLLDSAGLDVGKDYSRWNDVYLTLRGQYGARTTHDVPGDPSTSVMYVAAPIYDGQSIIGAVTVAKPNRSVEPVIERARRRLILLGIGLVLSGLAIGALLSLWLSRAVRRLTRFALTVSAGRRANVPELPGAELRQLAEALESMRTQLEGKAYVERYVQALTHELKSPLSAIAGAAELLRSDMQPEARALSGEHRHGDGAAAGAERTPVAPGAGRAAAWPRGARGAPAAAAGRRGLTNPARALGHPRAARSQSHPRRHPGARRALPHPPGAREPDRQWRGLHARRW